MPKKAKKGNKKIGKREHFKGKAQLVKTANLTRFLDLPINLDVVMKNLYITGKKPVIVDINQDIIWISERDFILTTEPPQLDFNVYRPYATKTKKK